MRRLPHTLLGLVLSAGLSTAVGCGEEGGSGGNPPGADGGGDAGDGSDGGDGTLACSENPGLEGEQGVSGCVDGLAYPIPYIASQHYVSGGDFAPDTLIFGAGAPNNTEEDDVPSWALSLDPDAATQECGDGSVASVTFAPMDTEGPIYESDGEGGSCSFENVVRDTSGDTDVITGNFSATLISDADGSEHTVTDGEFRVRLSAENSL